MSWSGPSGSRRGSRAVYLTFHRRDGPRGQLAGASRAVLEHLAMAGPLTVGEAAAHLSRAQSVVSEIVSHLQDQGLLERENDPATGGAR
jgi:DNA-binding MarR family transcriptional regulator